MYQHQGLIFVFFNGQLSRTAFGLVILVHISIVPLKFNISNLIFPDFVTGSNYIIFSNNYPLKYFSRLSKI